MKVAHFSIFAPRRCGLYHTAKELIFAERSVGIDAQMVGLDNKEEHKPIESAKDGSFETVNCNWAIEADVLVRHSLIPTIFQALGIPLVLAMHGRPESSLRLEVKDKDTTPIFSIFNSKINDMRCKAFVCFWEEYMDIWSYILPKRKLFYVQAPVDFEEYKPDTKPFDIRLQGGKPNILIADVWREDIVPFNTIFAAAKFIKKYPTGRLHIIGIPDEFKKAMMPFFKSLRNENILGYLGGQIKEVKNFYAAADVILTPHTIATRIIRESLSMNKPVIAGIGCKYTPYTADYMDIDSVVNELERWHTNPVDFSPRESAKKWFNPEKTGNAMKKVFEYVVTKESSRRKVLVDIGGHIGETIRKFYREVSDADEYEIYSFEPDPNAYKYLDTLLHEMRNLTIVNVCFGKEDGLVDFYQGSANCGEGSTLIVNKQTGGVDYNKPIKVECLNLARWLRENINDGDYLILKMNIEGGEYDLMELLLNEDLTGMIDKCYIHLHANKFPLGKQRKRFNEIEARFYEEAKCTKYMSNKEIRGFTK